MKLLVVSEYSNRRGSGYTTIAHGLVEELDRRGHTTVLLAHDYDGGEHPLKAALVSTDPARIPQQFRSIRLQFQPEAVVVIFDLTAHHAYRFMQNTGIPYIGIFPIEADPLIHPSDWTITIDTMDAALCESEFGTTLLRDAGIKARHFPVGIDSEFWRPPTAEERQAARLAWNLTDRFVVFTVGDNHERKNLPVHYAAVSLLAGGVFQWPPCLGKQIKLSSRQVVANAHYILNTKRRPQKIGYDNYELQRRFGVSDRCLVLEHGPKEGLPPEDLRSLYWAADAFLLLSKAEGYGLPVLEAMACRVPVVGTDCTGIAENLRGARGARGFVVEPDFIHIDPFHNQYRRWASPLRAAEALSHIAHHGARRQVDRGLQHARSLTWARAADVLEEALNAASRSQAEAAPATADHSPATPVAS